MGEYLVYEMGADVLTLSVVSIFAKAFIMGLMVFGVIGTTVGCALLVGTSILMMVAFRPFRTKYKEYEIEFTDL